MINQELLNSATIAEMERCITDLSELLKHKSKNEMVDDEQILRALGKLKSSLYLDWEEIDYITAVMKYYDSKKWKDRVCPVNR